MDNSKSLTITKSVEKKIDEISKSLEVDSSDRTVLKLSATDDPRKKTLLLVSGSWEGEKPWFVVDEKNEVHALANAQSLMNFVRSMQFATNENFGLKLEKAIWKYFPIDFQDVWVVATTELKNLLEENNNARILEVDIESLIDKIRIAHPNLFYHIKDESLL